MAQRSDLEKPLTPGCLLLIFTSIIGGGVGLVLGLVGLVGDIGFWGRKTVAIWGLSGGLFLGFCVGLMVLLGIAMWRRIIVRRR